MAPTPEGLPRRLGKLALSHPAETLIVLAFVFGLSWLVYQETHERVEGSNTVYSNPPGLGEPKPGDH